MLDPTAYGLDFWESLVGELVTIQSAHLVSRPNQYGDVWVRGNYTVTGVNGHGGLTMLDGGESLFFALVRSSLCEETATAAMDMALTRQKYNHVDANPEAIVVGSPLDGSKNPTDTKMGDYIGDVTGVVYNAFGTYRVLPLTAVKTITPSSPDYPATSLASSAHCNGLTVADYNAENLAPNSAHLPSVVSQIVTKLRTPDLIFLQEVQDNSGPVDNGVTSANLTLSTLTQGIEKTSGVRYDFVEVAPVDGQDGGQPGGNIRCAYLYRPDAVELYKPNPGGSNDENAVVDGPSIKYNPGRIGQSDANFEATRKPLVAMWKPVKGPNKVFFTINVHFSSKGGSTGLHGDPRPPVNKGVEKRTGQMELTAVSLYQIYICTCPLWVPHGHGLMVPSPLFLRTSSPGSSPRTPRLASSPPATSTSLRKSSPLRPLPPSRACLTPTRSLVLPRSSATRTCLTRTARPWTTCTLAGGWPIMPRSSTCT